MGVPLPRRSFLQRAGLAGAAAVAVPGAIVRTAARADASLAPFLHGVASGDPLADRVILWTRVTPPEGHDGSPIEVTWVVATDPALQDVVARGATSAAAGADWTVKVDQTRLSPGTFYFYGFTALGRHSLTGRTKTAPAGHVDRLRFGLVSCSNFTGGWFHAYARLGQRTDLDAILHLGDYLYEYGNGADRYGPDELAGARDHAPATEPVGLSEYRTRHAHYKLDPDLRALHQLHPFVTTWDDHETTDNSYRDGANNHDPETEGDWTERKRVATQAYREWMPIRNPDPDDDTRIWRTLRYGDLAEIVVLDTRLEGRSKQVEVGVLDTTGFDPEQYPDLTDPDRTLMSDAQWSFLEDRLANSDARWKVLAQQVMVMQWRAGSLPQPATPLPDFPLVTTGGEPVNTDAWDGYPFQQERLLTFLRDQDVDGVVVLTGDIHSSWAADLTPDPFGGSYNPLTGDGAVGVEFVVPSVTSNSFYKTLGYNYREESILIEEASKADNPHIKYIEGDTHGYGILDLTAERAQHEWWYAHDVEDPDATSDVFGTAWKTDAGSRHLSSAAQSVAPTGDPGAPPAAPPASTPTPAPEPEPAPEPLPSTGGGAALLGVAALGAAAAIRLRSRRASDPLPPPPDA